MFAKRFFAARAFAPRYFPPVPETDEETIAPGRRVQGDPIAHPRVTERQEANARIVEGAAAHSRVKRG